MDKANIVSLIVTETQQAIARGARRHSTHKSPYKKALNQEDATSLRVISAPSDKNILAWAEKVLLHRTGITASRLSEDNVMDEIRYTAKHLHNTKVFKSYEMTNFLIDTVKFALNHADEQLKLLRKTIHTAEEKSKLSSNQMTHNRIGTQQSLRDSLRPDIQKKQINTTGVV